MRIDIVPPIQWYEGMVLSSQHFQQIDLRLHQLLAYRLQLINPNNYGVVYVEHDPLALAEGVLRIVELEALMPDGEIVDYSSRHPFAHTVELDLNKIRDQLYEEKLIWCSLPRWEADISPLNEQNPRFKIIPGDEVRDNLDPSSIVSISRLEPFISIYAADYPKEATVALPIMKIVFRNGSYELGIYDAPCCYLNTNSKIFSEIKKIAQRIREKATKLSAKYQQLLGTPEAEVVLDLLERVQYVLPMTEIASNDNPKEPYGLYRDMSIILGLLSMLKPTEVCPRLPEYNHNQLLDTFMPLLKLINERIDVVSEEFQFIPFQEHESVFTYLMKTENLPDSIIVGIKFREDFPIAERRKWVSQAVIVSDFKLQDVIIQRLLGADRSIIDATDLPSGLYTYEDTMVKINLDPTYIANNSNLIIFNPLIKDVVKTIYYCKKDIGG